MPRIESDIFMEATSAATTIQISWPAIGAIVAVIGGLMTLVAWFMNYAIGVSKSQDRQRIVFDDKIEDLEKDTNTRLSELKDIQHRDFEALRDAMANNKEWARTNFVDLNAMTLLRADMAEIKDNVRSIKNEVITTIQHCMNVHQSTLPNRGGD